MNSPANFIQNIDRTVCRDALKELFESCPGVTASMLALRDGRAFMEKSLQKVDAGKFAAMSSSLQALGNSVMKELSAGELDHVLVYGQHGTLVIAAVPKSNGLLILAVLASADARLGMVLGRTKVCAQKIADSF